VTGAWHRGDLFAAVAGLFDEIASTAPVVLVLDDLHEPVRLCSSTGCANGVLLLATAERRAFAAVPVRGGRRVPSVRHRYPAPARPDEADPFLKAATTPHARVENIRTGRTALVRLPGWLSPRHGYVGPSGMAGAIISLTSRNTTRQPLETSGLTREPKPCRSSRKFS
jgi:hypothetical protein